MVLNKTSQIIDFFSAPKSMMVSIEWLPHHNCYLLGHKEIKHFFKVIDIKGEPFFVRLRTAKELMNKYLSDDAYRIQIDKDMKKQEEAFYRSLAV